MARLWCTAVVASGLGWATAQRPLPMTFAAPYVLVKWSSGLVV